MALASASGWYHFPPRAACRAAAASHAHACAKRSGRLWPVPRSRRDREHPSPGQQRLFHFAPLRFQRKSLRLGRPERLGAERRLGQLPTNRIGGCGQFGRCRTDLVFARRPDSLIEQWGRRDALAGAYNGLFWTMPVSGGAAAQVPGSGVPYTGDAVALPAASTIPGSATKYLVYAGNSSFNGSSLSVFDASTGTSQLVIANGPSATTEIAINSQDQSFYVGVGYVPDIGNIYSFSLSQIDSAYNSGAPLDFLSAGTLFNPKGPVANRAGECFLTRMDIYSRAETGYGVWTQRHDLL